VKWRIAILKEILIYYVQGVSKFMSEILRAYSRDPNKKKSSYKHGSKNAFRPSYSPPKFGKKCIAIFHQL